MKYAEFFRKHPVFTGAELAEYLSSRGEVGSRAQEALLAYHRKTGRVVLVRRGLYAVIPPGADPDSTDYGQRLLGECRQALSAVLPFTDAEREFLDLLLDRGEIDPTLLTADAALQDRIRKHPLLEWKTLNVRRHKGLS